MNKKTKNIIMTLMIAFVLVAILVGIILCISLTTPSYSIEAVIALLGMVFTISCLIGTLILCSIWEDYIEEDDIRGAK